MKGRIFIISAPSGTGKSTVVAGLRKHFPSLLFSVSCTTRPKRKGEVEGREYFFIDKKRFDEMIAKDEFAEWANVHNAFYGTLKSQIEEAVFKNKDVILDVDVQGGLALKREYPESVSIFLIPPSNEELERRLKGRGTDSPEQVRLRLENAKKEMACKSRYDFAVVNDDLHRTVSEISDLFAI